MIACISKTSVVFFRILTYVIIISMSDSGIPLNILLVIPMIVFVITVTSFFNLRYSFPEGA